MSQPSLSEILEVANSFPMWIWSILIVALVAFQAVVFIQLVNKFSERTGILTKSEITSTFRTGVISAFGPAMGVFIISVGLITQIGGPVTFMRVGVIGSAGYELMAATLGSQAYGAPLGGPGYNFEAFTTAVWTMTLGGCGWLIVTAIATKSLGDLQAKVQSADPKMFGIIGLTASLGAFSYLLGQQVLNGIGYVITLAVSGATMFVIQKISEKPSSRWLREWGLGISMIVGMAVATLTVGA